MLEAANKIIDERILKEEQANEFKDLFLQEDVFLEFLSNDLRKNNSRNGVNTEMNKHPFFLDEDTQVDLENDGITNLQNDSAYDDSFEMDYDTDLTDDDLTDLQRDVAYDDDYETTYDSDFAPNSNLDKDGAYNDTRTTPVSVDDFSAESYNMFDEEGGPIVGNEKKEVEAAFSKVDINKANTDASTEEELPDKVVPSDDISNDNEVSVEQAEVAEAFGWLESDDKDMDLDECGDSGNSDYKDLTESNDEDEIEDVTESSDLFEDFGWFESDDSEDDDEDSEDDEDEDEEDKCPKCGKKKCTCKSDAKKEVEEAFSIFEGDENPEIEKAANDAANGAGADMKDVKTESALFDFDDIF